MTAPPPPFVRRGIGRYPRAVFAAMTLAMYAQLVVVFGLAASAAFWVAVQAAAWLLLRWPYPLAVGFGLAIGFLTLVFALPLVIVTILGIFRIRVRAGSFAAGTWPMVRWATYNFYILLYRYTLMTFIRATPLHPWFYRLVGARIGKGVQINSLVLADCNLLTIGDYAVIGGDATVICHSYERGRLVIAPVTIGARVDIGLNAVIFPGVTIGDHAVVAAGSLVPKYTTIPPHTVWAGTPARQIRDHSAHDHTL